MRRFTRPRPPVSVARTTIEGDAVLDKAFRKSVEPYLEPGEELLSLTLVQGKGTMKAIIGGGAIGAAAVGAIKDRKGREAAAEGGIPLSSKMGLALTPRRLLIFKGGGAVLLKAKELLTEFPIGEVESIALGKGAITKPILITAGGQSFQVEAPKAANTDKLMEAFRRAKGAVAV
jgi:hypothetical protein